MSVAAAVAAVALSGVAVTAHSIATLVLWMAVAGFALGVAQPSSDAFLHGVVPSDCQGRAFSLKQAIAGPGVGLLAGLAVPTAATMGGWRNAFVGGAAVALAIACAGVLRARPPVSFRAERTTASSGGVLPLLPLVVLAVAGGLATAPQVAFVAFAVSSATQFGLGQASAGLLLAASCVPAIGVRLILGRRVDRRARTDIVGLIAALLALSTFGFILMSTSQISAVVVGMPPLAATAWGWHGLFFLVAVRTSPAAPGRAAGIAGSGTLVGAVAGPLLFGLGTERSFPASWLFAGVFSLFGAGSMLFARRAIVQALEPGLKPAHVRGTVRRVRLSRPS